MAVEISGKNSRIRSRSRWGIWMARTLVADVLLLQGSHDDHAGGHAPGRALEPAVFVGRAQADERRHEVGHGQEQEGQGRSP